MKKLKITFENLGFTNVITYINSGNIIFEAKGKKEEKIIKEIELAIKKDFALDIKVLIRDFESIKTLCKKIPDSWVKNETMRTDVMFLWEEFDNPKILEDLKLSPVDNAKYFPRAVVWNIKDADYNKSGMLKVIGTKIYKAMTIRNINTVRKIFEIMNEVKS